MSICTILIYLFYQLLNSFPAISPILRKLHMSLGGGKLRRLTIILRWHCSVMLWKHEAARLVYFAVKTVWLAQCSAMGSSNHRLLLGTFGSSLLAHRAVKNSMLQQSSQCLDWAQSSNHLVSDSAAYWSLTLRVDWHSLGLALLTSPQVGVNHQALCNEAQMWMSIQQREALFLLL